LKLTLTIHFTEDYPNALPDVSLEAIEGTLDGDEMNGLMRDLRMVGEENIGMAMTFTLVSDLREKLSSLVLSRAEQRKKEETERQRVALELEEARTRGTPVTVESFRSWRAKFNREVAIKKAREEDERLKGLTPKEREEWKRIGTRPTGRQLFERNKNLEEDTLMEEGTVSVDISQYERTGAREEEEEDHITFSDSD